MASRKKDIVELTLADVVKKIDEEFARVHDEFAHIKNGGITVEIINGGGTPATFKLPDIIQKIYDRPKSFESGIGRVATIARNVFYIAGAILTVSYGITKFIHP